MAWVAVLLAVVPLIDVIAPLIDAIAMWVPVLVLALAIFAWYAGPPPATRR